MGGGKICGGRGVFNEMGLGVLHAFGVRWLRRHRVCASIARDRKS